MKNLETFKKSALNKQQQQNLKAGSGSNLCSSGKVCQGEPGRNYPAR